MLACGVCVLLLLISLNAGVCVIPSCKFECCHVVCVLLLLISLNTGVCVCVCVCVVTSCKIECWLMCL